MNVFRNCLKNLSQNKKKYIDILFAYADGGTVLYF